MGATHLNREGEDRPVVVVGLMGSGKTTLASRLARQLGRPFRDNDVDLLRRHGGSAADQYRQHGVALLHAREAELLREALAERPPPVVAAAASVVDNPDCRAALATAFVVWLNAPPPVLAGRLRSDDHRPHFDPDPRAMLARQYRLRAERFRSVADLVLDVSVADPQASVEAVIDALRADGVRVADPDQGGKAGPSGSAEGPGFAEGGG